jgi:hypothetical protein
MDKKAFGYAEPILDYFATLLIFFIIAIFFFLFWLHSSETKSYIMEASGTVDGQIALQSFLLSETKMGEEKLTIHEFLNRMTIIDFEDQNSKARIAFEAAAKSFLAGYHKATGCNAILVYELQGQAPEAINVELESKSGCKDIPSVQLVPRQDGRLVSVRIA